MSDETPVTRKLGRRPRPAQERAVSHILVRARPDERQEIQARAAAAGQSLSRYLVAAGLSERPAMSKEEREEWRQLLFELRKAGVNLNQVAHTLNVIRQTGSGVLTEQDLAAAITGVKQAVAAVVERLP